MSDEILTGKEDKALISNNHLRNAILKEDGMTVLLDMIRLIC